MKLTKYIFAILGTILLTACSGKDTTAGQQQEGLREWLKSTLSISEQTAYYQSLQESLEYNPVGQAASWQSFDNKAVSGITIPTSSSKEGEFYCRNFKQEIKHEASVKKIEGEACRNVEGIWYITKTN